MTQVWTPCDAPALPDGAVPPMQQHPLYGAACAALGARAQTFALGAPADPDGTALVLLRRWPCWGDFALVSRGPLWRAGMTGVTRRAALRALVAQLRRDTRGVLATPDVIGGGDPLHRTGMIPMVRAGHRAVLDLTPDTPARRARARGKWRNRLVRAEAAGLHVTITSGALDACHWLLRAEADQRRTRRYAALPAAFTAAWTAADPDAALLIEARPRRGADPVAAMLFLCHGAAASYHLGWSGPAGRDTSAHHLLLWTAAATLADRGARNLDLGTLDTETTPGLARFKLGCGADVIRLGQTWLSAPGTGVLARLTGQAPRRQPAQLAPRPRQDGRLAPQTLP